MSKVDHREKAKEASQKRSTLGYDIDLSAYSHRARDLGRISDLKDLPDDIKKRAINVGIDAEGGCRSGSFFQIDHSVILSSSYREGLEIMSITEALMKYDWLSDYWWNAVQVDADKYTAQAELNLNHGYFLILSVAYLCFPGVSAICHSRFRLKDDSWSKTLCFPCHLWNMKKFYLPIFKLSRCLYCPPILMKKIG